jgi:uncharacterized membrane protein YesL
MVTSGNALRKEIWEEFKTRFGIESIIDYFGATDGAALYVNVCEKVGACGRRHRFMMVCFVSPGFLVYYLVMDLLVKCVNIA